MKQHRILPALAALLTALLIPGLSQAENRYHIGETKPAIAPAQAQAPYTIEWELSRSDKGAAFQTQDKGTFCYGKADPCFDWVGQTLAGQPDSSIGNAAPVWEYGIGFSDPKGGDSTDAVFTNLAGLRDPAKNQVLPIVPNFLQGTTPSKLGTWSESIFQLSADTRLRVRARLVRTGG